jgi:hypothetical protein
VVHNGAGEEPEVQPIVTFDSFTLAVADAVMEFERIAEADIRRAHGERVFRPPLSGIPEHIYKGAIQTQDADLKAHEDEVEAQRHLLDGTREP